MAIQELKFSRDWNNAEDFPVVAKNAEEARANIQLLHDETKKYINDELVPAVQAAGDILKHCWRVRDFDPVTGATGEWRYVYSEQRNTYPDSGIHNEREYEYLGVPVDFATPPGGRAGQVLAKATDADHDYHWADLANEVIVIPGEGGGDGDGGESSGGQVVVSIEGAVRYNISQSLTPTQKSIARTNIGAASQSLAVSVGTLEGEVEGLKSQVASADGRITELSQTVDEIKAGAGDGNGNSSELAIRVDEIEARVEDNEENIAALSVRADEVELKAENAAQEVASFSVRADSIDAKVADNAENISTVEQKAASLEVRVGNAENEVSTVKQTAASLETRVSDNENSIAEVNTKYSEVKQTADSLTSRVVEVEGAVDQNAEDIADNAAKYSEIKQTVNNIRFTVSDPIDGGTNRYVTMTLTVGNNTYTGVVMIDGNVDVSGQLSAEALYATLGDIARLKVDSLSTSRRIPMYLAGDTSDDNYIDIQEQHITLRRAWTDGSTEQARDDFGALLYWEQDISGATLGTDGYPYVDGARVFITTEVTDYPVTVYSYDSGDRLKIFFDEDNNYGPRMVWGEGDGGSAGNGRGYLEKLGLSFDIYNKGTDGVKRGMFMGNEYVDIVGERLPTKMVWSGNTLTVTYQGGITRTFTFTESDDGSITAVTFDGHTVELEGF